MSEEVNSLVGVDDEESAVEVCDTLMEDATKEDVSNGDKQEETTAESEASPDHDPMLSCVEENSPPAASAARSSEPEPPSPEPKHLPTGCSEPKIGFSIAQIMGFEKVVGQEDSKEEETGKLKLWRPQPAYYKGVFPSLASSGGGSTPAAANGHHPLLMRGDSPATSPVSILRHYSLFGMHPANQAGSAEESFQQPPQPRARAFQAQEKRSSSRVSSTSSAKQSDSGVDSTTSASGSAAASGKPKTFPCGECGKIFNAHYNLTRHMPVHTGKKLIR